MLFTRIRAYWSSSKSWRSWRHRFYPELISLCTNDDETGRVVGYGPGSCMWKMLDDHSYAWELAVARFALSGVEPSDGCRLPKRRPLVIRGTPLTRMNFWLIDVLGASGRGIFEHLYYYFMDHFGLIDADPGLVSHADSGVPRRT